MAPYVYLGSYVFNVCDIEILNHVVLLLPHVRTCGLAEIKTIFTSELCEEKDVTCVIDVDKLIHYLKITINSLYNNHIHQQLSKGLRDTLCNIALEFLDSLLASDRVTAIKSRQEYMRLISNVYQYINEESLPMSNDIYTQKYEEEAQYRFINRKAKIIQDAWRDAYYDPTHKVCKKRLLREFNELYETFV